MLKDLYHNDSYHVVVVDGDQFNILHTEKDRAPSQDTKDMMAAISAYMQEYEAVIREARSVMLGWASGDPCTVTFHVAMEMTHMRPYHFLEVKERYGYYWSNALEDLPIQQATHDYLGPDRVHDLDECGICRAETVLSSYTAAYMDMQTLSY